MTGNQALLLVLALGGAAVLDRRWRRLTSAARPGGRAVRHGCLRPVLAELPGPAQRGACGRRRPCWCCRRPRPLAHHDAVRVGLVPMVLRLGGGAPADDLDRNPDLALDCTSASASLALALVARLVVLTAVLALLMPSEPAAAPAARGRQPVRTEYSAAGGAWQRHRRRRGARPAPARQPRLGADDRRAGRLRRRCGRADSSTATTVGLGPYLRPWRGEPVASSCPPAAAQGRATGHLRLAMVTTAGGPGPSVSLFTRSAGWLSTRRPGVLFGLFRRSLRSATATNRTRAVHDRLPRSDSSTSRGTFSQGSCHVTDPRWLQLPAELPSPGTRPGPYRHGRCDHDPGQGRRRSRTICVRTRSTRSTRRCRVRARTRSTRSCSPTTSGSASSSPAPRR